MRTRVIYSLVLLAVAMLFLSTGSFAQVGIAITIAPPVLPVYEQPICPGDGYIWTPGYWAWDDGYYWVPGTWVIAPEIGFLWTPGYWGWGGDGFMFYPGYWGSQVGFYGGVNYGFGYCGRVYEGGRWDHVHFFYNTTVNNVNVNVIHNVYNRRVNEVTENRVSYNGGHGGINARPSREEEAAGRERHIPPLAAQTQHAQTARNEPQQRFSANHGAPPIAATAEPGAFRDRAVPAREAGGGAARPENNGRPNAVVHPRDLPPVERPGAPNTGNPKLDQRYQQQQEKLIAKQNQERGKLQQQQEKEHQQMAKQQANDARMQQTEQRHQQQTQQLQQRHTQQMQQRQQPPAGGSRGGERH